MSSLAAPRGNWRLVVSATTPAEKNCRFMSFMYAKRK
jgi:hypothetical protein